jgi:hypothetical protein
MRGMREEWKVKGYNDASLVDYCISPLNSWTVFKKQFSRLNLGNNE